MHRRTLVHISVVSRCEKIGSRPDTRDYEDIACWHSHVSERNLDVDFEPSARCYSRESQYAMLVASPFDEGAKTP